MKREEAKQKTISALLETARRHFTQYGYFDTSLEAIAEEAKVTRGAVYHHFKNKTGLFLGVIDMVQQDVAVQIEQEAMKSDDFWQQLILGCCGFIKGANKPESRRILLVDAPVVIGWDAWRKADKENSAYVLQNHIADLKSLGYLNENVDTEMMTYCISGALNELALNYLAHETEEISEPLILTVSQMVSGFKKNNYTQD